MRRGLLLLCALIACGADPEPTREPADDRPRGPRGAAPARCTGEANDPPELETTVAGAQGDLHAAIVAIEALVGAHAGSATARVRLGELLLRDRPPRAAEAATWFERALALHGEGCRLRDRDRWAALEGSAQSRLMRGDYEGALPFLRRASVEWPRVRMTRYNFACALCRTGDVDGCANELAAALREGEPGPAWEEARPPGHYAQLAREDPDLAPLRTDPERFERILGAR